ncbi:MAG: cyclophilin-like fold protein [Sutterellaceae bacterium]|nr:cyclophilin-like fold protein [Sutterellaceae bacterium]
MRSQSTQNPNLKIFLEANGKRLSLTLANTRAAQALLKLLPIECRLKDYGGFEKVGPLGARLPSDDTWIEALAGDVLLYTGNQIVLMLGTNAWNYTRLGRIDDVRGLAQTLGPAGVTIKITTQYNEEVQNQRNQMFRLRANGQFPS